MSINFKVVGLRIKKARIHKHITQALLAEKIDLSVTYISQIETAKKQVSLNALVQIANELGITVDYVLSENLTINHYEYVIQLQQLLDDCTIYEKQVIYDIANQTKDSLRRNAEFYTSNI